MKEEKSSNDKQTTETKNVNVVLHLRQKLLIALSDEETPRLSVTKCILVHTSIHGHLSQLLESDGL